MKPYAGEDGYGFAERDEASLHLSLDEGHGPEAYHQHVGTAYLYDEWARPGVGGLTRRVCARTWRRAAGSR